MREEDKHTEIIGFVNELKEIINGAEYYGIRIILNFQCIYCGEVFSYEKLEALENHSKNCQHALKS